MKASLHRRGLIAFFDGRCSLCVREIDMYKRWIERLGSGVKKKKENGVREETKEEEEESLSLSHIEW